MPIWSNQPPEDTDHRAFRIVRTPAEGELCGVVTADEVLGCPTHFFGNRTLPCEGEQNCPACQAGHSWRWHGYVAAVLLPEQEHVLFEFTATASESFRTFHQMYGSMRCCRFTAKRPSGRNNGRVVISCRKVAPTNYDLPPSPDVQRILCHIWGIAKNDTDTNSLKRPPFRGITVQREEGAA